MSKAPRLTHDEIATIVGSPGRQREKARLLPKAIYLYREGYSAQAIAGYLGPRVTARKVTKWLKEIGLTFLGHPSKREIDPKVYPAAVNPLGPEILRQMTEELNEGLTEEQKRAQNYLFALGKELERKQRGEKTRQGKLEEAEKNADLLIASEQAEARFREEQAIQEIALGQSSPAEQYMAYIAAAGIRLLRDSIDRLPAPKNIRELAELDAIIRRNLGLSGKAAGAGNAGVRIDINILNNAKADRGNGAVGSRPIPAVVITNEEAEDLSLLDDDDTSDGGGD